jgi:orotidine-5'-phosphate decarboxylase
MSDPKIIVALDFQNAKTAVNFARTINPKMCRLKVGKELFTAAGPQLVQALQQLNFEVFLDLKFHDIPNTVAKACQAASNLGVWMVNVHASGGFEMMQAAREAIDKSQNKPMLIAVTVLTSMSEQALQQIGIQIPLQEQVLNLANLSKQADLNGVVCSAQEATLLKENLGEDFCLVTPGIRPKDAAKDDQTRIVTPQDALKLGAHYLVIGRPITQAEDPLKMLEKIYAECNS